MEYQRFTQGAQKALTLAQESAQRMGHNYVGTEHLLLGLIETGDGSAAQALQSQGVTAQKVVDLIDRFVGRGGEAGGEFDFTPRTKRILQISAVVARQMGHSYVGTEHLLMALLGEGETVAARILQACNIDGNRLVQAMTGAQGNASTQQGESQSETKTLDSFGRDLTQLARDGMLDPVIGRDKEIERVIQVLCRRTKNNPVLIGEPGVGKSAIAEELAHRVAAGNIPQLLKDRRVISLDLASMVAGTKYRGEFEERLKTVLNEIKQAKNIILFIDEVHTLIGAGAAEGAIDAANILKPALARGEIQCISATTLDEYRKYIEKDAALERRFQPVMVGEPTTEHTVEILRGLRDRYEAHHRVKISDEAINAAVQLSDRYIADRFLPDKAIDLMDEAAARVRIRAFVSPPDMKELEVKLQNVRKEKEEAVSNQNFERAAAMRDEEKQLLLEMEQLREKWDSSQSGNDLVVTEEDIADIVANWTGIPARKLTEGESERLLHLEEVLHERVIGQNEAVSAVARAIRRARAGLKDPNRPIGSFLFLGPTGVGKTELSRALAQAMFGDEDAMVRLDMSEYMEKHTVSRMVGSPPGYVGYDEGGQLTEKVRRRPYCVVLLDEIEKAHPDVFNVLLQILEDGRLTDGKGRTVNFRNTVVIMTSNVGSGTIAHKTMGFGVQNVNSLEYQTMRERTLDALRSTFRPEFLNRVDETVVFHSLEQEDVEKIASLMLKAVKKRLLERDIDLSFTDAASKYLAKIGFDPLYGARPLRRAIQQQVEDNLSEEILANRIAFGDSVEVDVKDDKLTFEKIGIKAQVQ
jgi:ATP-dependent Clp protease ATP-binding subunit ClpC